MQLKNTALSHLHEAYGAKMVPFAGYHMPVSYKGLIEEHLCVRENAGVFDVSHMGEFWVTGPEALDLIQKVCSNDASKLIDGKVQYSCLPNDNGGIVDDLLVYRINAEEYMLVVNASNIKKDWDWINSKNTVDAQLSDRSSGMSLLAVQGPKAAEILQPLTDLDLANMKYYTFDVGTFAGIDEIIVSATGYTGAGGFEIYIPNASAETVWNRIFEVGAPKGLQPIGLGARDTLRLEMGYCLYGNDIDDTTSPIEAGLSWITKFSKEFVNSENLKAQKESGSTVKLVGFEMMERGIPRQGYEIMDSNEEVIGRVTSGTQSPSLDKAIGMGYVPAALSKEGSEIIIAIRKKRIPAKVVKLPFYKG